MALRARLTQKPDTAIMFIGEAVDLIHAVEPAGVILDRVIAEAEAALARRFA